MEGIQRRLCETTASCYQALQTQKDKIKTVSEKVINIATPYFNQLRSEMAYTSPSLQLWIGMILLFPKLTGGFLLCSAIAQMILSQREQSPEGNTQPQDLPSAGPSD